MSRSPAPSAARRTGLVSVLLAALLGGATLRMDRGTIEHANRMYRGGDTLAAIAEYRAHVERGEADPRKLYNLGTSLVSNDRDEAERVLVEALEFGDSAVANPAFYNLAYGYLTGIRPEISPDSTATLLRLAITSSRIALRFDLGDEDARWNLALAQRLLDSISMGGRVEDRLQPSGQDETRIEDLARTRSPQGEGESGREPEQPRAAENVGQRRGAAEGAREAWASQDPGPIEEVDARLLLDGAVDDPETLIRGLLWAHRPDVEWWASQAYPGGNW